MNVPDPLFTVESSVTLQGRNGNTAALLVVNGSGTLIMNSGSKISGNQNTSSSGSTASSGSGVYVSSRGTFKMRGGGLSENTATSSGGGGVYVDSSGAFTKLVGGVIYGSNADAGLKNTATAGDDYGHAVYVSSSKKRNGTAFSDVTLDSSLSGSTGCWE